MTRLIQISCAITGLLAFAAIAMAEDEIELLNGTRIRGKIIERSDQSVRIQVTAGGRELIRSFPVNRVRAVTHDAGGAVSAGAGESSSKAATEMAGAPGLEIIQRSPAAIDALIEQAGKTTPEWFEAARLEYPPTLDLSWPDPTPDIWNYTRNVEHFIWDIINSNPSRYRSGVKLMHHLLEVNRSDAGARFRAMNELGRMYFEFFADYGRAAFWWREAKASQDSKFVQSSSAARLAECYSRLGNRDLAVSLLDQLPLTLPVIKAWGDLRETERALRLCEEGLRSGFPPSQVYLLAGDACRTARAFTKAADYYRKVLEIPPSGKQAEEIKRDRDRAEATLEVIRLFDTLNLSRIADGTYLGQSLGYAGSVEMEVGVSGGRIELLRVKYNPDRQYYHAVEDTIRRIMARQTVNGVDAISGATFTSEAVIRASAKALAQGMAEEMTNDE